MHTRRAAAQGPHKGEIERGWTGLRLSAMLLLAVQVWGQRGAELAGVVQD